LDSRPPFTNQESRRNSLLRRVWGAGHCIDQSLGIYYRQRRSRS